MPLCKKVAHKQQAHKLELELTGAREQEKMLSDQVEQQEHTLGQLQTELRAERERHGETVRQLSASKKVGLDLQADIEALQKQIREHQERIQAREDQISRHRQRK
ncbi:hypothetical protein Btru_065906 [Bulinus truncatus]|nr:hypothetical protein Btru_065906 [Bulinus truncatus]